MAEINHRDRSIRVKIVYYGPAVGGKTTNLKVLFDRALGGRRGQFLSVNSAQDRTILCDLLPLRSGGFRGHELKLQLAAVPGQAMYAASRRIILRGVDGIVFVANSATDRWHETQQSFQEMTANLLAQRLDPRRIPLVLQYNKRDLPQVMAIADLSRALNDRRALEFAAVASKGEGVLETFSAILALVVDDLRRSYAPLQLPEGQTIETWTRQAVLGMFGALRLEPKAEAESEPSRAQAARAAAPIEHMKVRIFTPQDAPVAATAGADSKATDVLAESYAEASAQLGIAVNELREERDLLRVRLDEVQRALELATEAPGETDIETRVRAILQVLVTGASASGATLLLYTGETAQVLALPPLVADPLSRTIWGTSHVEAQRTLAEPQLAEADSSAELAQALRAGEPSFEAVAYVPLRSAERLLGIALLYFDANAAVPTRERLVHVGFLARVLSGPLEAMAAREATLAGDRQKVLSRASAAAVASLLTRLPSHLARRQHLRLAEVLSPLRVPGIVLDLRSPEATVVGDAALLRFTFATLVRQCETDALERNRIPEVSLTVEESEGAVHVLITGGGRTSVMTAPERGLDLTDAEMSVVHAIVALHGGVLVSGRGEDDSPLFTVELILA
ncbi:MAG TPA: GTPase domain-containing protein [Myxococcota bacterium]|nr:GTPase domain-containing protein [Myxococcota bacterium]